MTTEETAQLVDVAREFYDLLASLLPGDTTLNELRVLTEVASSKSGTSVCEIAKRTGVSTTTVSRLIGQWSNAGQIVERPHPDDGRRKILTLSVEAKKMNAEWALALRDVLRVERVALDAVGV